LDQHRTGIGNSVGQTGIANYDPKTVFGSIHSDVSGLDVQAIRANTAQHKAQLPQPQQT
jgi:hypothetical protein